MIGGVCFYSMPVDNDQCPLMTVERTDHYKAIDTQQNQSK